jgi:hypothetical protein
MSNPLFLLSVLAAVILVSGCIGLDPEALAKSNSMIQQFLSDHPNAEIKVTHFTADQAKNIMDQIRKDCDNPYLDEKEFYRVNIKDPDTDFYAIVWIDWGTKTIECVFKIGTEGKTVEKPKPKLENCTEHAYFKCYNGHIYWFSSCGTVQEKKEYCNNGCSGERCLGECKSSAESRCYGDNVYLFDSCGNKQEKKEYCQFGCENGFCKTRPPDLKTCEEVGGYCIRPSGYCGDGACSGSESEQMCPQDCATITPPSYGGGSESEGQAICENRCAASDIKFADLWLDKETYVIGDVVRFYAKLVDINGEPATPEEGNRVYLFAVSPKTGFSASPIALVYNLTTLYYEYVTTPVPSNVDPGMWAFSAAAENNESFIISENIYVTINPSASSGSSPPVIPPEYESCIGKCLLRFRVANFASIAPSAAGGGGAIHVVTEQAPIPAPTGMVVSTQATATSTIVAYQCREGYEVGKYFCNEGGICCIPRAGVCTDSDGGKNYYQQGTAAANGQSLTDHCNSDGTLTEKYCEGNQINAEVYKCPYGCNDGACISPGQCISATATGFPGFHVPAGGWQFTGGKLTLQLKNMAGANIKIKSVQATYAGSTATNSAYVGTIAPNDEYTYVIEGLPAPANSYLLNVMISYDNLDTGMSFTSTGTLACENAQPACANEGGLFSVVYKDQYPEHCCEGLTEWESGMDTRIVKDGQCVETGMVAGSPVGTCIKCGDALCKSPENICNCLQDCKPVPPCTKDVKVCPDGSSVGRVQPNCDFAPCPAVNVICTDSDGGLQYYIKGSILLKENGIPGASGSDYCTGVGNDMIEYICQGSTYTTVKYSCPNGCSNGACIEQAQNCTDSDGGYNFYKYGDVKDATGIIYSDICIADLSGLSEFVCGSDSLYTSQFHSCVNENMICSQGACVQSAGDSWCHDTDGGYKFDEYGIVSYSVEGNNYTYADTCAGDFGVSEGACDNKQWTNQFHSCVNEGKICSQGACVTSAGNSSCNDSDGGYNFNTYGTVSYYVEGKNYTYADACVNEYALIESACDNKQWTTQYHSCKADGKTCQNGACI